ncbi:phosphoribosylglycinamide formyltransferase [Heliomicrobium modesticaldum Ice1]|uniref:Phosphoribosylglycinamide formyltransferase n=1 Tax=Heliobacterium modesticaldum (strain ATCC 51547 / Ice1) TaxID=498761 RepID=B0TEC6_HELMI|nr:phosphoribosylglycinamide formyltransferase [Heliomicrobium modesticaldum]ABZ85608.1 phosphoribosylglycinamide formyltransferase [Heliomicrobium modesticaldum Ice1]
MTLKLGVLASGRGSNLQAVLDAIDAGRLDAQVVMVLSNRQDAPALERAALRGIPAVHLPPSEYPQRLDYDRKAAELLKSAGADTLLLAGYMRLITTALLDAFPGRIINIHPTLLPAFPGLHGHRQAIDYGVRFSGCTVHFVDEGLDSGPIILQAVVPVHPDDNEDTLAARILKEEHRILPEALQLLAEGRLRIEGRRVIIE